MSDAPESLVLAQRWMHAVITHPEGVVAGLGSDEHSERTIERLSIYSRAYLERLLSCMRAEYPVLLHLLGRTTFDAFATSYVHERPPRSYTLADLGSRFAEWLEATRPVEEQWPELFIDLARLERAFIEVFDGPGEPRTLTFRYPVGDYFHAVRAGDDPPVPEPRETTVTLTRPALTVKLLNLSS